MKRSKVVNHVKQAIEFLGGDSATARIVKKPDGENPTPKAVRKWRLAGKLPRTEATGETTYAEQMAQADPRINADELIQVRRI